MRNATKESVNVSNLRVGSRTSQLYKEQNGTLVADSTGTLAADGFPVGLLAEEATVVKKIVLNPQISNDQAGAYIVAQSEQADRLYRFGFDPEKDYEEDILLCQDVRFNTSRFLKVSFGKWRQRQRTTNFQSSWRWIFRWLLCRNVPTVWQQQLCVKL